MEGTGDVAGRGAGQQHGGMLRFVLVVVGVVGVVAGIAGCGRDRGHGGVDGGTMMTGDGSTSTDGGTMMMPTDGGTMMMPTGELVDPACIDGMYSETLPAASASVSDLVSGYAGDYQTFVDAVLTRRYPIGANIVRNGRMSTAIMGDCVEIFLGGRTGTASDVFGGLGTVVHECGHLYDLGLVSFGSSAYVINDELTITCSMGDTTDRGGQTFARSLMNGDDRAADRPPCGGAGGPGCDGYADVYLDGDPFDGTFDGGDQGFNSVMEEATQYVNSLATAYAYADQMSPGLRTSAKDGILTFLWYIERYLRLARLEHPASYEFIAGDPCWRQIILTVWGRAWLYLELTRATSSLGLEDAALFGLVEDPELVSEIQRIRDREGCGG